MYAKGSSSKRPYQILNEPYNIAPRKLKLLHPQKFDPHFRQILRGRGKIFAFIIRGRPRPVREKNFGNCTLAHFPEIEFQNFAENRFYFELQEIAVQKKVDSVRRGPPL